MHLPLMKLIATVALGTGPLVEPHPLVTAAEALCQRKLPRACDLVVEVATRAPGRTAEDIRHLHFLRAMRKLDAGRDSEARAELLAVLQSDRRALPPPFAPSRLLDVLEAIRAGLPPSRDRAGGGDELRPLLPREPAVTALLQALDVLYASVEMDGARVVVELIDAGPPLSPTDRGQVAMRRAILELERFNEPQARIELRESLVADVHAVLPDFAPPKARRLFEEERARVREALDGARRPALAVGGAGLALVTAGVVAGTVALKAHWDAEHDSNKTGSRYVANATLAKSAGRVADGLYATGAVGLAAGTLLFLHPPGGPTAGISVEGHF